jgi:hypothetical protein
MERLRTLWTMTRRPNTPTVVAAIFDTPNGHELRIMAADDPDNVLDSLLSETGDAPLEARAAHARRLLEEVGWRVQD